MFSFSIKYKFGTEIIQVKIFLIILLYAIGVSDFVSAQSGDLCKKSTRGKEFWFGFMESRNYIGTHSVKIVVSSQTSTTFTIAIGKNGEIYNESYAVDADSTTLVEIPWEMAETTGSEEIQNKGIHLVSQMPVSVYALSWDQYSSDAAVIYPVEALGKEYFAMCYYPDIDRSNPGSGSGRNSEFLIVATEDGTSVEITPSKVTDKLVAKDSTFQVILNKGEVYQVQSENLLGTGETGQGDLTGSHIVANKPVAFYSGALATTVPNGVCCWDHLYEQIPPLYSWGRKYFAVPLKTREKDIYRVLAAKNNTSVQISGEEFVRLNSGEFHEFELYQDDVREIIADKPILVAQFSLSHNNDSTLTNGNGDPFMLILNSANEWINEATFENFASPKNEEDTTYLGIKRHFVNVVAPTAERSTILLDGQSIQQEFKLLPDPELSYAQIETASGTHNIRNSGMGKGFMAYAYGFGKWESYGYNAGSELNIILDLGENIEFFKKDTLLLCNNDSLILDAGTYFDEYLWNDGTTNPTLTVKNEGWYWVQATVTDGCNLLDSVYVFKTTTYTELSDQSREECQPFSILLSGNDGYDKYLWQNEFGDTLSTNQTYLADQTGEYINTVFDKYRCSATDKMKLTIFPVPEIKINGDSLVCGMDSTWLDVSITGNEDSIWNFEGNYSWSANNADLVISQQTRTSAKITVPVYGNYEIFYHLTTIDGCQTIDTFNIRFHPQPSASFNFEDDPKCEGYSKVLDFSGSLATDSAQFIWDLDGCQFTDTINERQYTVSVGAFLNRQPQIQMQINDNGCLSNIYSETLSAAPNFEMNADNTRGCDSLWVNFTSRLLTPDNVEYKWTLDDKEISEEPFFNWFFPDTGFHKVNLTITNPVTQCENGFTIDSMIKVFPTPIAKITADPEECYPDSARIVYTNNIDSSFCYWEFSGMHQTGEGNDSITVVIDNPTGKVQLTVDEYGCISQPVEMELKRKPRFDFITENEEGCQPFEVEVFAEPMDDYLTLSWITDSLPYPTEPSYIFTFADSGRYDVAMAGWSAETGCTDTLVKNNWIWVHPKPWAKFEPDFPVALLENARITFTNYSENAVDYTWDFDDGNSSMEFEPVHVYTKIGDYTPQLTATSAYGCTDTFFYDINILTTTVYAPNAFRPNSDIPENRTFMPVSVGTDENRFNFKVFDRWGQMVFESNSPYEPWDGKTKNGDDAPIGNYVWIARYYDIQGFEHNEKGQVLLLR